MSDQIIDLLKVAANHLEVRQKSLIDELVQSRETLDQIASESQDVSQTARERRQLIKDVDHYLKEGIKLLDKAAYQR